MQSIRKYLTVDEIISFLEKERKLVFPNFKSKAKFRNYLNQYNYNVFVKGLKNRLMFDENEHYKKEFDSNQVRYLFDIDRRIATIVFKYFKSVEFLFNNSITKILSKEITKRSELPYLAVLSKDDFQEIFTYYKEVYKQERFSVDNLLGLIVDFFKNYTSSNYYDDLVFRNKDSEHHEIIKKIEQAWFLKDRNYFKFCKSKKQDWIYIEIFSLTSLWSFSQLVRIYKCLNNDLKNLVIKDFAKYLISKHSKIKIEDNTFVFLLEMLLELRNMIAHNANLIKFRFLLTIKENNKGIFKIFDRKNDDDEAIFYLRDLISLIEKCIGCENHKIINEIKSNVENKVEISLEKGNTISDLIFKIIEDESKIRIKE